ncbi:MAG: hypothetical protein V7647_388 [Acidobacteriota bacterium]
MAVSAHDATLNSEDIGHHVPGRNSHEQQAYETQGQTLTSPVVTIS